MLCLYGWPMNETGFKPFVWDSDQVEKDVELRNRSRLLRM